MRHQHEEEKRARKLKKLSEKLGGIITASEVSEDAVQDALRRNAESLKNNQVYQAWKSRN